MNQIMNLVQQSEPATHGGSRGIPPFIDPDARRDPPEPATPLDFPVHTPVTPTDLVSELDLSKRLPPLKRISDVQPHHVGVLNLRVSREVDFASIIPRDANLFAPPLDWWEDSSDDDGFAIADSPPDRPKLSNGEIAPGKSKYEEVHHELLYDNEDAFRAIHRLSPKQGRASVKVRQTRSFFQGLMHMSQYWDASQDEYFPATSEYKGFRKHTGREMPPDMRETTVKAFVEMVAWAFSCHIASSEQKRFLAIQKTLIDVRRLFRVTRGPRDRIQRRKGIQEGPVMALQCHPETSFRRQDEKIGEGKGEMWDLLREVGVMLLLAQERAREGAVEVKLGVGQWWTTAPRWGGGPNAKIGSEESKNPLVVAREPSCSKSEDDRADRPKKPATPKDRLALEQKWTRVEPGSIWNEKMNYVQIGKDKNSDFDDIFLISSINHHVSVLRLRVHPLYLEWLATGYRPALSSAAVLDLQRTRWLDLFDPAERVEAMDGLWGLFGYLMRSEE